MRWWGPGTRSSALVTMFTTAKHKVIHRQSGAGVMYDAGADVVTTTIQTNKPTLLWYLIVTTNTWWRVFSLSLTSNSRANTLSDISQQYNIVHLKNILVWINILKYQHLTRTTSWHLPAKISESCWSLSRDRFTDMTGVMRRRRSAPCLGQGYQHQHYQHDQLHILSTTLPPALLDPAALELSFLDEIITSSHEMMSFNSWWSAWVLSWYQLH